MTTVDTYEGWTNRETWAVALWLNNDEGMQESVYDAIREGWTAGHFSADQPHRVGDIVEGYVEDLFDWSNYGTEHGGQVCVPAMLLTMLEDIGSLYRVDWSSVGASFLADALEGVDAV